MTKAVQAIISIVVAAIFSLAFTVVLIIGIVQVEQIRMNRYDDATQSALAMAYSVIPGFILWVATFVLLMKGQSKYWAKRNEHK
jgi:hypothetical protein